MTATLRRILGGLFVLTILLAACSGDDDDGLSIDNGGGDETTTTSDDDGGDDDGTTTTEGDDDGGDDIDREDVLDVLAEEFAAGFAGSGAPPISDGEARCAAEAMLDELGLERLADIGLETQGDLTDLALEQDEAERVSRGIVGCLDVAAILTAQLEAGGIPTETASCIAEEVAEGDLFVDIVTLIFTGGDPNDSEELTSAVQEAAQSCS